MLNFLNNIYLIQIYIKRIFYILWVVILPSSSRRALKPNENENIHQRKDMPKNK
jgi:hypothetical protein